MFLIVGGNQSTQNKKKKEKPSHKHGNDMQMRERQREQKEPGLHELQDLLSSQTETRRANLTNKELNTLEF